jgi:virulence factor Mce-like protein
VRPQVEGEVRPQAGLGAISKRLVAGGNWLLAHPYVPLGIALAVVIAIWAIGTRSQPHHVRAEFAAAVDLYTGLDVSVDGLDAGRIDSVQYQDGHAIVDMGIDNGYWPVHRGTRAAIRYGTTIGNATRYIDLTPGPSSAPVIPEGGLIPLADTATPTEFDQIFNIFDAAARSNLQQTLRETGSELGTRGPELNADIKSTPAALEAVGGLAQQMAADQPALAGLVENGARVTATLATRQGQIADLMTVANATFHTFASNTAAVSSSLDRLPATLGDTRGTLAQLDGSIEHLNRFVAALRPGAAQLKPLAITLRPALRQLRATVPTAVDLLRTGIVAGPPITTLLNDAIPFSRSATPAFTKLAPMISCITPYSPEIAGMLSTWSSWPSFYDGTANYGRVFANFGLAEPNIYPDTITPAEFTKLTGQQYALVRPPGYNIGQPWYMPQCGAGHNGLDAADDPEAAGR